MTGIETVEHTLDRYVASLGRRGVDPDGFRTRTLARLARVTGREMGDLLQQYRLAQSRGSTRYVLACRGYGRASRWSILAKPGSDPAAVRAARAQATRWSAEDMARRFVSDAIHELRPGLRGTELDDRIRLVLPLVEDQLAAIVAHVDRVLTP